MRRRQRRVPRERVPPRSRNGVSSDACGTRVEASARPIVDIVRAQCQWQTEGSSRRTAFFSREAGGVFFDSGYKTTKALFGLDA